MLVVRFISSRGKCGIMFEVVRQVDVAPTIAEVLGFKFPCDGRPINRIVEASKGCRNVILLIVDSLGFNEYVEYRGFFSFVSEVESLGFLFKCLSYSRFTTPSIATLLCGLKPEKHGVWRTEDAYRSTVKNVVVVASKLGYKAAVVMEKFGALSFQNRVDFVRPVEDVSDIKKFDETICSEVISVLECFSPNLVVAHLRTLDKLGFKRETVAYIDMLVKRIFEKSESETLMLICGDHPPHGVKSEEFVALIALTK